MFNSTGGKQHHRLGLSLHRVLEIWGVAVWSLYLDFSDVMQVVIVGDGDGRAL
jgi:hypothetical protein